MSGLGQKLPCGTSAATSEAECIADVNVSKADIAARTSAVEGIPDVDFATAHDCFLANKRH